MTECELCKDKKLEFHFGRLCCRVRFLLSEPRKMIRQAWLIRWTTTLGRPAAVETLDAVKSARARSAPEGGTT